MSLSRRALFCAGCIIILAIMGIWSGEPLTRLWRWPGALLLIVIAIERLRLSKQYTCTRQLSSSIPLGQQSQYQLIFTNHGKYKLYIESQPDHPETLVGERPLMRWNLAAGATQSQQLTITPVNLGNTTLGNLYIRVLGRYGLVWWSHRIDYKVTVKIEAATMQHNLAVVGRSGSGNRRPRFKPGSGFELLAMRDYRQGDPLRAIDWKATAKRQKPIVRIFDREQRLELAILIDCGRAGRINCGLLDRLHHFVNVASRLTEFAVHNDDRVACIAYADSIINIAPMTSGIAAIKKTRALLDDLAARSTEADPLGVALEVKRLLKRRGLVVFLTEIDQLEASTQLIEAVHLLSVKHQVMVASIEDEAIIELTQKPAQHWLDPYQNFAALEYTRGREIIRNKLQRQGVSVVTAPAQQIDQSILQNYQQLRERAAG